MLNEWAVANGLPEGSRPNDQAYKESLEKWKTEQIDKERREIEGSFMYFEDRFMRSLHREEVKSCIVSRKTMCIEDLYMKTFLTAEREDRAKPKFTQALSNNRCKNERRSEMLKKNVAKRQRVKREVALMQWEDEQALSKRAFDRREKQLEMLEEEFHYSSINRSKNSKKVGKAIQSNNHKLHQKQLEFKKSVDLALARKIDCELELMDMQQDLAFYRNDLTIKTKSLKSTNSELIQHRLQTEEICMLAEECCIKSQVLAFAHSEAQDNAKMLSEKVLLYQNQLRKLEHYHFWTDTSVLTNVQQRWKTTDLHMHLIKPYFDLLLAYILALVEERVLQNEYKRLDKSIYQNEIDIQQKRRQMKTFKRKYLRSNQMRRRRSDFTIFKNNRMIVQKNVFLAWRKLVTWKIGQKKSFELRYKSLLHTTLLHQSRFIKV